MPTTKEDVMADLLSNGHIVLDNYDQLIEFDLLEYRIVEVDTLQYTQVRTSYTIFDNDGILILSDHRWTLATDLWHHLTEEYTLIFAKKCVDVQREYRRKKYLTLIGKG